MKQFFILTVMILTIQMSVKAQTVPVLNSLPGATATVFLDFDGQYIQTSNWNNGLPINCAHSGMSNLQITETFNRVSEDFRPFVINITTDSTVFLAAPLTSRMRVIITPTNYWLPGVGGVAYASSFTLGEDMPAFVFCNTLGPNNPKLVAEACSHEIGHTLGLSHQAKYDVGNCTTPVQYYHTGTGSGETGWAPIMGVGYYKNFSNWNNGPTPYGCNNVEDNLSIIATQNGFTFRSDDFGETLNASTYTLPSTSFNINGIITTNTDKDAFRFVLIHNSNINISAKPFSVSANNTGANLDIKLELFNGSGALIRTYYPIETMNVSVDTILLTGTYYLKITGDGNANINSYGSLGAYTISGISGPLPIRDITLSGSADKGKHILNWKIVSDEPIKTIVVESSTDGINFKNLTNVDPSSNKFSYSSFITNTVFYRLKVTSVIDQTAFSKTIAIVSTGSIEKSFFVSTLVQNEVAVNAPVGYRYVLSDLNGRIINSGTGIRGVNKINVSAQQRGMYFIRLINNDQIQTERIIKQ